jgi:hypothetical protein
MFVCKMGCCQRTRFSKRKPATTSAVNGWSAAHYATIVNLHVRRRLSCDEKLDLLSGMSGAGWKSRGMAAIYPAASVDAVAHVLRDETVIVPDDADNRNVYVRENIGWGANNR